MLQFKIPDIDPDLPKEPLSNRYTELEKQLVNNFNASVNGHLFQVQYSIKIFVKHDAMT